MNKNTTEKTDCRPRPLLATFAAVSLGLATASIAADGAANGPGVFSGNADVGSVKIPGTVAYDHDAQRYEIAASGSNMWGSADEFHFVWKKMSGDFILSADAEFLGDGVDPHRKLGWMIRSSLDTDAAYVDVALHGDGLTSLQFRRKAGAETQELRSQVVAPDVLQLERRDGRFAMAVAKKGEPLTATGLATVELPDTVYVGLFVCAHNADVTERAQFSNVRISERVPADFQPYRDYYASRLEVMEVASGHRRVVHTEDDSLQAPNWTRDGKALIYNRNGRLYRFDLESGASAEIDTGFATNNNNDHAISFDGQQLAISHQDIKNAYISLVYTMPIGGGVPKLITPDGPSYFHGWSPDGKWLTYTGGRDDNYDIYKIRSDGSGAEVRLTTVAELDDGSEFSPDGEFIYFNSARSGTMEIWRMRTDGSGQEQVTDDPYNNWFPHISPDGSQMIYLAYMPEVEASDHPWYKSVYLVLRPVAGGTSRVIANLYGGQGTINVPSWSPDGQYVAFVSNTRRHQAEPGL